MFVWNKNNVFEIIPLSFVVYKNRLKIENWIWYEKFGDFIFMAYRLVECFTKLLKLRNVFILSFSSFILHNVFNLSLKEILFMLKKLLVRHILHHAVILQ